MSNVGVDSKSLFVLFGYEFNTFHVKFALLAPKFDVDRASIFATSQLPITDAKLSEINGWTGFIAVAG